MVSHGFPYAGSQERDNVSLCDLLDCQTEVAAAVGEALVEVDLRVLVAVADVVDAVGAHGVLGGVEYLILLTVLAEKAGAERCDVDGERDEGGGDEEG